MRLSQLSLALIMAGLSLPALAGPSEAALLEDLAKRLAHLEARNTQLEMQVKALKGESDDIAKGLDSPRLSQYEPELTVRLKAVEKDALEMKKGSKIAESLDGIKVGASLLTVVQGANGMRDGVENAGSQLNYRADLTVELPLQSIGDIDQKVFGHFRLGQGQGLNDSFSRSGHYASAPNAGAFRASGAQPDDSVAILGQAWYQAAIPLPLLGFRPYSRETLEVTFGKMDIFGFFDQNAGAGDESKQFLNSVFVHNPLLDAGGEVGVDKNGFQPGFVTSYLNYFDKREPWRLSLGVFGAGEKGASYQRSFNAPLVIAQAETQQRFFGGLLGNYRLYTWRRGDTPDWDGTTLSAHRGVGASVDQRIDDGITMFARYGRMLQGETKFSQAVAVGAEISGGYWSRGADAIGVGHSWLKTGDGYGSAANARACLDEGTACAVATPFYTPEGAEGVTEIYYRFRLSPQVVISPDFQSITRAGGSSDTSTIRVFGLRANIAY